MNIAIGSDAAGFDLKTGLVAHLEAFGHDVTDVGCNSRDPSDYPDFARAVGVRVREGEADRGVLICGTGQGMAIAANKIRGVRAALAMDTLPAFLSREHNDANVLCFGGWLIDLARATRVLDVWLAAPFAGGVHLRRVEKIAENQDA